MRCKACDTILEEFEIIWDQERREYEELCKKCRMTIIYHWLEDHDPEGLIHIEDILDPDTENPPDERGD